MFRLRPSRAAMAPWPRPWAASITIKAPSMDNTTLVLGGQVRPLIGGLERGRLAHQPGPGYGAYWFPSTVRQPGILRCVRASVSYDPEELKRVERVLGTRGLASSVRSAFKLVLEREAEAQKVEARDRLIRRLREMRGLDLDKPEVLDQAWR